MCPPRFPAVVHPAAPSVPCVPAETAARFFLSARSAGCRLWAVGCSPRAGSTLQEGRMNNIKMSEF